MERTEQIRTNAILGDSPKWQTQAKSASNRRFDKRLIVALLILTGSLGGTTACSVIRDLVPDGHIRVMDRETIGSRTSASCLFVWYSNPLNPNNPSHPSGPHMVQQVLGSYPEIATGPITGSLADRRGAVHFTFEGTRVRWRTFRIDVMRFGYTIDN